jgi:hypothetical protein
MKYKYRVWLHGLVAAVINGLSSGAVVVLVDPIKFNLFQGGARELGIVCSAFAALGFFTYLKTHPLPDPDKDTDYTKVTEAAVAKIQSTGDGGTGDGAMPRALGVLMAIGLTIGAGSCTGSVPPVKTVPAAVVVADESLNALAVHSLDIVELATEVLGDASRIELAARQELNFSPSVQAPIDRGFLAVTRGLRALTKDIDDGVIKTWAAFKVRMDPIARDLQTLITDVKGTGPSLWRRIGRGLMTAASLLIAATVEAPQ